MNKVAKVVEPPHLLIAVQRHNHYTTMSHSDIRVAYGPTAVTLVANCNYLKVV